MKIKFPIQLQNILILTGTMIAGFFIDIRLTYLVFMLLVVHKEVNIKKGE